MSLLEHGLWQREQALRNKRTLAYLCVLILIFKIYWLHMCHAVNKLLYQLFYRNMLFAVTQLNQINNLTCLQIQVFFGLFSLGVFVCFLFVCLFGLGFFVCLVLLLFCLFV